MQKAFSLVELSIVLVILGLLTGGILAGQSLIRAAELRSISSEYARYVVAVQSFREKYMALPGDMPNATRFWGAAGACPGTQAQPSTTPTTCNGNGNGQVTDETIYTSSNEVFRFWQHLANANLVEGTYTGVRASTNGYSAQVGLNVPASKISNAGWHANHYGVSVGDGASFAADYGNAFHYGIQANNTVPNNAALTPEELWSVDNKIDDGKPALGKVIAYLRGFCTVSTSPTDTSATYNLTNKSLGCSVVFGRAF